ncbi:MAG: DUF2752 domain-containing protein [Flavobacterium sp.]|nr:DUF2752 domain-containing protein [Pedobacter sp.]
MKPRFPLELLAWITVITVLAFSNPASHHYTICPFNLLKLAWCPGCGLGRALISLIHLEFSISIKQHWFGIPALLILLNRIWNLFTIFLVNYNLSHFKHDLPKFSNEFKGSNS